MELRTAAPFPPIDVLNSSPLVPQDMTVFGDGDFKRYVMSNEGRNTI